MKNETRQVFNAHHLKDKSIKVVTSGKKDVSPVIRDKVYRHSPAFKTRAY